MSSCGASFILQIIGESICCAVFIPRNTGLTLSYCLCLSKRKSKGEDGYDPLYKVRCAMTAMLQGINKAWIVGQRVKMMDILQKRDRSDAISLCGVVLNARSQFAMYAGQSTTNTRQKWIEAIIGVIFH